MSTCWSKLWFSKIFQKSRIVYLIGVARWFKFGAIVQDVRILCAVCTLQHSHKSEWHRPICFILAGNRPTPVLKWLSRIQTFLGRSQPGCGGPNAGMKYWRARGRPIGAFGSPLVDNTSTKQRRGFLERRRLGDGFRYRVSCARCFGGPLRHYSANDLSSNNLPTDGARELIKPSKDAGSLVV